MKEVTMVRAAVKENYSLLLIIRIKKILIPFVIKKSFKMYFIIIYLIFNYLFII